LGVEFYWIKRDSNIFEEAFVWEEMTFLKKIGEFIKDSFGKQKKNSIITEYFKEIEEYLTPGESY
jgi:hypothetical protein